MKQSQIIVLTCAMLMLFLSGCAQSVTQVVYTVVGDKATVVVATGNARLSLDQAVEELKELGILKIDIEEGYYAIDSPLVLVEGMQLTGASRESVIIEQMTQGKPGIDVLSSSNIAVNQLSLIHKQSRHLERKKSYRGKGREVSIAGIYYGGSNGEFSDLYIEGYTTGILLASWDPSGGRTLKQNNHIRNVEVSNVDFGVLGSAQSGMIINGLEGSYGLHENAKSPPHLIYMSGDSDIPRTNNFEISDCHAYNSRGGHAFKVKNVENGVVRNMTATNCAGVLLLAIATDVEVDEIQAFEDDPRGAGSVVIDNHCSRITARNITIESASGSGKILRFSGEGSFYSNISLTDRQRADSTNLKLIFDGSNSIFENFSYLNLNPAVGAVGARMMGNNLQLNGVNCTNCELGVILTKKCETCRLEIEPAKVTWGSSSSSTTPFTNLSETATVKILNANGN